MANYPKIRSGFHFRKEQPAESHVLVQAYTSSEADSVVFDNQAAVPAQGNFTALVEEAAGTGRGYFSGAPGGNVAYCTDECNYIWGGDEMRAAAFVNHDPGRTFSYDFTEVVNNTKSDSLNVAT